MKLREGFVPFHPSYGVRTPFDVGTLFRIKQAVSKASPHHGLDKPDVTP
jgi:hypothetical protein